MRWLRTSMTALALAPLAIAVPIPDSSTTRVGIAGGGASYLRVVRGCEGEVLEAHRIEAGDLHVDIEHAIDDNVWIGVRAGAIWSDVYPHGFNPVINPHFAREGRRVGFGAGFVWRDHELEDVARDRANAPVSGHLRFGRSAGVHLLISWLESPSLVGDGFGLVQIWTPRQTWGQVAIGLSALGPHDTPGADIAYARQLGSHVELHASGRLGAVDGSVERGASLGLRYGWWR